MTVHGHHRRNNEIKAMIAAQLAVRPSAEVAIATTTAYEQTSLCKIIAGDKVV